MKLPKEFWLRDIFQFLKLLVISAPLWYFGIVSIIKYFKVRRLELILPLGFVTGFGIYIFLINLCARFFRGDLAVVIAYLLLLVSSLWVGKNIKIRELDITKGRSFIYVFCSLFLWGSYLFWKAGHPNFGGDNMLYYSFGSSFLRGNYPPVSPWQPDLALRYHTGLSFLLASLRQFSRLTFEYVHIWINLFFGYALSQIFAFMWVRPENFRSFISSQIIALMGMVSFGGFMVIIPDLLIPLKLAPITLYELFKHIAMLPTFATTVGMYGGGVANIDAFFYFSFRLLTIAFFITSLILVTSHKLKLGAYILIAFLLLAIALTDESVFIIAAPAVCLIALISNASKYKLIKNFLLIFLFGLSIFIFAVFQGGVITDSLFRTRNEGSVTLFFPKAEDLGTDLRQNFNDKFNWKIITPNKSESVFYWFHPGSVVYTLVSLLGLTIILKRMKKSGKVDEQGLIYLGIITASILSLIAFPALIPKYAAVNSIRFLSTAYQLFGLALSWLLLIAFRDVKLFKKHKTIILYILIFFIFIPSITPPLLANYKDSKKGKNQLLLIANDSLSAYEKWIINNTDYSDRILVFNNESPNPNATIQTMVKTGMLAPVFSGEYRAYTINVSPDYWDVATSFSPSAMRTLGVDYLVVDSKYYSTLPSIRQKGLFDGSYFKIVFEDPANNKVNWLRIFQVKDKYINLSDDAGTLSDLDNLIPNSAKVYLDKDENIGSYTRRPLALTLKDRDLYFIWGPGLYLNIETDISHKEPKPEDVYDYLILASTTDPQTITQKEVKLIWSSSDYKLKAWKIIDG